jgi:dihydrofolate reductase
MGDFYNDVERYLKNSVIQTPDIHIIAAMTPARVIGAHNGLPWHISADLKRFKALTMGHRIVMGRNTYDSIGRPLPGRENIVVSRSRAGIDGCTVLGSLEAALDLPKSRSETLTFVIGGAQLYAHAMQDFAARIAMLHITHIYYPFEGDTFFPAFSCPPWQVTARERYHSDARESAPAFDYEYITYQREE